jgi:tetratricopeptide (TPR) repeat protein
MEIVPYKPFRDLWVFREVASGGMSVVYLALAPQKGRFVALKTLLQELWEDPEHRARFQREVSVQRSLQHPHIVRFLDGEVTPEGCFLGTEFLRGDSLDVVMKRHPHGLPVAKVVRVMEGLTAALFHAHSKEIVHRDIQPRNIILEHTGSVKLFDFGISLTPDHLLETKTGTVMGTFAYSSPEQNQGREVDDRSDIYSLGLVMHELLTGQRAIQGSTLLQITEFQLRRQVPPPGIFRHDIPEGLSSLIHQLVQRWPEDRPRSARHVLDALIQLKVTASEEERRQLEVDGVEVQLDLARRVLHGGRPAQALDRAQKAERLQPGHGAANVLQGRIHAQLGDAEATRECFQKAWEATPDDPEVAIDQALSFLHLGQEEEVLNICELATERFGPNTFIHCLTAYLQARGMQGMSPFLPPANPPEVPEVGLEIDLSDFELDWEEMGMSPPTPPPEAIPQLDPDLLAPTFPVFPPPSSQLPRGSVPPAPTDPSASVAAISETVGPGRRERAEGTPPRSTPLSVGAETAPTQAAAPVLVRRIRDWQKSYRLRSPAMISLLGLLFPGLGPLYLGRWKQGTRRLLWGGLLAVGWLALLAHPDVLAGRLERMFSRDAHLMAGWTLALLGLSYAFFDCWQESQRYTAVLLQQALAPPLVEAMYQRDGHVFLVSHGGGCEQGQEYLLLSGGSDPFRSGRWLGDASCVQGGDFRAVHRFVSPTGDLDDVLGGLLLPRAVLGPSEVL